MGNFKPTDSNSDLGKMMEKFENIRMADLAAPSTNIYPKFKKPELPEIEGIPLAEHIEKTEEYQTRSLEMLQSISENTANLYTIVDLINKSKERQDELLDILSEILAIAKAKEKNEAETLFKRVMTKINESVKTADSIVKLVGWATTIYNMVVVMLPK